MKVGQFCISLDFELMWGVKDSRTLQGYGAHILGVREAVPAMLSCFKEYGLHATWATVGLMACRNKKELLELAPEAKPRYRAGLSSYDYLDDIGDSEADDPYHYGESLIRCVQDCAGQEIGSHSFSHYYCAEQGASRESFEADILASKQVFDAYGVSLKSYVFARNQMVDDYADLLAQHGYESVRGNPQHFAYNMAAKNPNSKAKKLFRLADAYLPLSGAQSHWVQRNKNGLKNVPASRFFYPYSAARSALEPLKLLRIKNAMTQAAKAGELFHLWWHPHNLGQDLALNLHQLAQIGQHFEALQDKYGMRAVTMGEADSKMTE